MVSWDQHRVDAHQAKFTPPPQKPDERGVDIEGDLHDKVESELKRRRWFYVHSRLDKPTTNQVGAPDFIIAAPNGKVFWIELKKHGGKLSKEQNITRHCLLALGQAYEVVYSFKQFVNFINSK